MKRISSNQMMNQVTIDVRGVSRRYGSHIAVDNVDLILRAGECIGLVGHNGAGKSTMIKMMLGLVRPDGGVVRVLGEDPSGGPAVAARRALGYLPENVALHPSLTGAETLAFYARLKGQPVSENARLLERVGIENAANRRVGTYSKGMRQRLGLAQALLGSPRAMLLDEPTSGLDPALRQSFYEIIRELRRDGAAILLSSHALAELEGQVDRVVVMNRGRKVADGGVADLRKLAALPPRIRFLPDGAGPRDPGLWSPVAGGRLERACAEDEVAAILGGLPGSARDIEILRPSLDDLYAEFQKGAA
jgi:Cu-processing system ATP-binding protein